eukprot:SAG31_NODE_3497_length_4195_cov_5.065430_2_plen_72_part_00
MSMPMRQLYVPVRHAHYSYEPQTSVHVPTGILKKNSRPRKMVNGVPYYLYRTTVLPYYRTTSTGTKFSTAP